MAIEGQEPNPNPAEGVEPKGTPETDPQNPAARKPEPAPAKNDGSDRERGLLADLQKERKARQDYENKVKQFERDLESAQKRIQALAGVSTPSDEEAQAAAIRAKLETLYPALKKLDDATVDKLLGTAAAKEDIDATQQHYWQQHGRQMVSQIEKQIQDEIGSDLTERQKEQIAMVYSLRVERDQQLLKRHLEGDPTLISEFAKAFLEDWSTPIKRQLSKQAVDSQPRVPRGKDRSVPGSEGKKIDVNDPKQVEDLLVEGFKSRGGVFGRR